MTIFFQKIETSNAPKAVGPYSQGLITKGQPLIFVSGQLPVDSTTGKIIVGDIQQLTSKVIDNIEAILKEVGSSLEHVVRTEVFLLDLKNDYNGMNEVYSQRFTSNIAPTRQTVQVAALPLGSKIEISCVAVVSSHG
jgi:2-iminobutanoate/2-iminopropanoate deaminase